MRVCTCGEPNTSAYEVCYKCRQKAHKIVKGLEEKIKRDRRPIRTQARLGRWTMKRKI